MDNSTGQQGAEWCPVCHTYHPSPGEKTDAGKLTRQCPRLPADHPANVFENYPGRVRSSPARR